MQTPFEMDDVGDRVVYIRPIEAADLPEKIRIETGVEGEIYAIHDANGEWIGLAPSREMAFHYARQHELAPQSVH